MSATEEPDECKHLSVKDMRDWFSQELKDLDKARELRIRDASSFVEAYAKGELTPKQAGEKLMAYEDRWGEALPGTHALPHLTDEAIIAQIDKTNAIETEHAIKFRQEMGRYACRNPSPAKGR